jgi:hypothetical protein
VGFEPTIPAFEQAKTVHALDRASTVIGPEKASYLKVGAYPKYGDFTLLSMAQCVDLMMTHDFCSK